MNEIFLFANNKNKDYNNTQFEMKQNIVIELNDYNHGNQTNRNQLLQQNLANEESISTEHSFQRIDHPLVLFIWVVIAQIITIHLSLLLVLDIPKHTVFIIYICMTVVRSAIWFYNSYWLLKFSKELRRAYFKMDNHLVMYFSTCMTYVFLNYSQEAQPLTIAAIAMYPILFFFLVGNYRAMIIHCNWSKRRTRFYKWIKVYASLFFLAYGIVRISSSQDKFLLYVFTTFGFYCQLYFGMEHINEEMGFE